VHNTKPKNEAIELDFYLNLLKTHANRENSSWIVWGKQVISDNDKNSSRFLLSKQLLKVFLSYID
jgi:hypothetical protein